MLFTSYKGCCAGFVLLAFLSATISNAHSASLFPPERVEAQALQGFDPRVLWLPKSYKRKHERKLIKAASVAAKLDECDTVLRGTLDFDNSTDDHPIYRILCRRADGSSYNEAVDGLTYETLTTRHVPLAVRMSKKIESLRGYCRQAIAKEVTMMQNLSWLEKGREPVTVEEDIATFVFDFDATNEQLEPLYYRGTCNATIDDEVTVSIRTRRD